MHSQPLREKSHQKACTTTEAVPFDRESLQEFSEICTPPGKKSQQAARTTTGAAPFDRLGSHFRSLKFAPPVPERKIKSHQKVLTTTGAAPFDRESLQEFEICTPSPWEKNRTRWHVQRRELLFDRGSLQEFEICTPSPWEKHRTRRHVQRRELRRSIGNQFRSLKFALPAPGRNRT